MQPVELQLVEEANRFPDDCLPPEAVYDSRDALFKAINAWAAPRGYTFVTGRSHREKSGKVSATYACDRGGQHVSKSDGRRRRLSRRTGCDFSVTAKQSRDQTTWTLKHRPDSRYAVHNHDPNWNQPARTVHGMRPNKHTSTTGSLTNAGPALKDIMTHIRQKSNTPPNKPDVYSRVAWSKRKLRDGHITLPVLANHSDKEGFWNRTQFDDNGRVKAIVSAHPKSWEYLKANPDLLLLDCKHGSNAGGMPLLDVIGLDANQKSFYIAFAFLGGEDETDHVWALDRVRSLYELCGARLPSLVLTERCTTCMAAVARCFPAAISSLCPQPDLEIDQSTTQPTNTRSHTRHDPATIEADETLARPKAQPKCSRCHTVGHIMTSRLCPLRNTEASQQTATTPAATGTGIPRVAPSADVRTHHVSYRFEVVE